MLNDFTVLSLLLISARSVSADIAGNSPAYLPSRCSVICLQMLGFARSYPWYGMIMLYSDSLVDIISHNY